MSNKTTKCWRCKGTTKIQLFTGEHEGRKSLFYYCDNCHQKMFYKWAEPKAVLPDGVNEKSIRINEAKTAFWDWLENNLEKMTMLNVPDRVFDQVGRLGGRRRNKGKISGFGVWNKAFIDYLNTPKYLRRVADMVGAILTDAEDVKYFILMKAAGYTYAEMDQSGLLTGKIQKDTKSPTMVFSGKNLTTFGETLADKTFCVLMLAGGQQLFDLLGIDNELRDDIQSRHARRVAAQMRLLDPKSKASGGKSRCSCPRKTEEDPNPECHWCFRVWEAPNFSEIKETPVKPRVICPKCGGIGCDMCRRKNGYCDGMVQEWVANAYLKYEKLKSTEVIGD